MEQAMRALSLLLVSAWPVLSQQVPTTLKHYEPVLENELVRVGRVTLGAGESEGVHRHPRPRVLVCLQEAVIQVKRANGSVEKTHYRRGHARFQSNRDPHEPANVGPTRFRGVVVEFKAGTLGAFVPREKLDPLDPLVVAPGYHTLVLENSLVRVLDVNLKPGEFEPSHRHIRSVLIILRGGTARIGLPDGSSREDALSGDGEPPAPGAPPPIFWVDQETHSVRNIGTTPIRLLRVEVK